MNKIEIERALMREKLHQHPIIPVAKSTRIDNRSYILSLRGYNQYKRLKERRPFVNQSMRWRYDNFLHKLMAGRADMDNYEVWEKPE